MPSQHKHRANRYPGRAKLFNDLTPPKVRALRKRLAEQRAATRSLETPDPEKAPTDS